MAVRRLVSSSWLLACCLALTGCAEAQPSRLPSLAPLAAVTTAPVPAAAEAATPAGAVEFVRFWYAEITRAWAERDPAIVARLSAPGCEVCQRYIASMTEARAKGHTVTGVVFTLRVVEAQGLDAQRTRVTVVYDGPRTRRVDAQGRQIRSEPAVQGAQETVHLARHGTSWRVESVT